MQVTQRSLQQSRDAFFGSVQALYAAYRAAVPEQAIERDDEGILAALAIELGYGGFSRKHVEHPDLQISEG
ncbi:hypothetical protein [Methanofollis fontis]|uniref:hypothetical protein n=1 Tax=Methanofollis fontis TaxID=2052832 RepID=UPI00102EE15C|nr:hypothetical protein [Methanofollis fontis]